MEVNLTITLITKHSKTKHEHEERQEDIHRKTHMKTQINIPICPETSMGETKGL